jgi:hypothetical protein
MILTEDMRKNKKIIFVPFENGPAPKIIIVI